MKCPSCDSENDASEEYCTICGTKLSEDDPQPEQPKGDVKAQAAAAAATSVFAEQEQRARKKSAKKVAILILAVVIVVIAAALSAKSFLFPDNDAQNGSPAATVAEDAEDELQTDAAPANSALSDFLGTWICEDYDSGGTELTLQVCFYYDSSNSSYYEAYWEYPRNFDRSIDFEDCYPQDLNSNTAIDQLYSSFGQHYGYFTSITGENNGIIDSRGSFRFDLSDDGKSLIMTVDAYGSKQQTGHLRPTYTLTRDPRHPNPNQAYTSPLLIAARGTDSSTFNWYMQREDFTEATRFYEEGTAYLPGIGKGTWYMEDGRIFVYPYNSESFYWFCFGNSNLNTLFNIYKDSDGNMSYNKYLHTQYSEQKAEESKS